VKNLLVVRIACGIGLMTALAVGPSAQSVNGHFQIATLSARPDYVSGGDVLIRITVPPGVGLDSPQVTLNGEDITTMFRADPSAQALTGLVTGLRFGSNTIAVSAPGQNANGGVPLTLMNHPVVGPVFSGPHEQPFICQTEQFTLQSGEVLGKPLDEHCSIRTRVDYYYRSTAGGALKPVSAGILPADLALVTTLAGATLPYIVRIETGTINRAIYQIAMLHNPAREPEPDFVTHPAGWNGRLIYTFGGGCVGGWYRQGAGTGGVVDEVMLQRGYAVASASLNVFGNNCAELLAAETMMMVKERFIEAYGPPKFTIGWGGSGGSYQQHQIADNYPGLLDGIIPARSFPDLAFGTVPFITDARLLEHYFDTLATVPYTDEQKRQISGFGMLPTMNAVYDDAGRVNPMEHCPDVLSPHLRYDPVRNPKGTRCDVYDHAVNVYGRDPKTGFARRPLDNVGIQYGLTALNQGTITTAQFLELNEKIGGFDHDGTMVASRTVADPDAIRAAYRSGRLTNGGGGLATTPIIDYRAYLDDVPQGNVHVRYHSFSLRARLLKANGYADNHVMLTDDRRWGDSLRAPVLRDALSQMDQWLTTISEDTSSDSKIAKLRRARPADLVDACWTRDDHPQKIAEPAEYGGGQCESLYPAHSFPRGVAGSPVAADIIKCQLKPISADDYQVVLTADVMARLRQIFPGGVCDWSRPGVEQERPAGTWLRFGTGRSS
jgi:hypothetical protein